MSPLRVLRGFIFGGMGGLLAWVLIEFLPFPYPFQPARFEAPGSTIPMVAPHLMGLLGLVLGLCIGGFLGLSEGIAEGTVSRFTRAVLWFVGLGALGGFVGLYFGQQLYGALGGRAAQPENTAEFFHQIIARGAGWTLIGIFLGLVFGVPNASIRRMFNGAVGGAIGGFLGGFFFQTLTSSGLFVGMQGRLIGFAMLGAIIGFFINLIAEAMKRVWVKVLIGRNEGREFVLDTPIAYVGRDELADIPVFLDPMVPKRMASFRLNDGRYSLYPESGGMQITVNGQPLQPGQVLRDGDAIQFGRVTLGYFEKATASGMGARPVDRIALPDYSIPQTIPGAVPIPSGPNVCEFCGERKDPVTGACACSVADGGGYPAGAPAYSGYDPAAAGGYAPQPDYGGGYGAAPAPAPAYAPAQDPAYGATMLDPAGGYAAPDPGGPRFVATAGPYAGQAFPLQAQELWIGRDPAQDVPLPADSTASRRHARVYYSNGSWVLRDEGSSNGTWVNGVRIQEQPLFPGDNIRIGQTFFQFEA